MKIVPKSEKKEEAKVEAGFYKSTAYFLEGTLA
jgi:hypothetical protein